MSATPVITNTRPLAASASGTVAPAKAEIPPTTESVASDATNAIMNTSMMRSRNVVKESIFGRRILRKVVAKMIGANPAMNIATR